MRCIHKQWYGLSRSFAIHIIFLNNIYVLELVLIDASNGFKVYSSPSNNLHVTIGGTVGAFVIVVIGVVFAIIVIRYVSGKTFAGKKNPHYLKFIRFLKTFTNWYFIMIWIILALKENQEKWLKDSHLFWKQDNLIWQNQKPNNPTYQVRIDNVYVVIF